MFLPLCNTVRKLCGVPRALLRSVIHREMAHTPSVDPSSRLVWIDLELTDMDHEKGTILEVACVITDVNLDEVSERLNLVINQPDTVMEAMGEWCQENHRKTGLFDEVRRSTLTMQDAEKQILDYLKRYVPAGQCCLTGNTVYKDRFFLMKCLPKVNDYLHYRIIDVSSIKELCRRWNREIYTNAPQKLFVHRALEDILESIAELRYYKQKIFDLNTKENR